jgi:hypothetical protein
MADDKDANGMLIYTIIYIELFVHSLHLKKKLNIQVLLSHFKLKFLLALEVEANLCWVCNTEVSSTHQCVMQTFCSHILWRTTGQPR